MKPEQEPMKSGTGAGTDKAGTVKAIFGIGETRVGTGTISEAMGPGAGTRSENTGPGTGCAGSWDQGAGSG